MPISNLCISTNFELENVKGWAEGGGGKINVD